MQKSSDYIASVIRRHHGSGLIRRGANLCQWYLAAYWNERHYKLEENGELQLLGCLAKIYGRGDGVVVFDVGANVGHYTDATLRTMPGAEVHCFEVISAFGEHLEKRRQDHQALVINRFGLSDRDADVAVTFYPDSPTEGRIHARPRKMRTQILRGHVRRGDDYIRDKGLSRVDFLKIDTEGHELFVLNGFAGALSEKRITTIQFEYGSTWLAARTLLSDAYDFLSPRGYTIGRLFPDGVRFKDFGFFDEHFRMGNYIAVRADREDLIRAFSPPLARK